MKALFLVALIIALASASVNIVSVPSDILGNWNYDAGLQVLGTNTCGSCTYNSLSFTNNTDDTITMGVTATGTGDSCSGSYVLQGVVANGTLASGSISGLGVTDQNGDAWTISMSKTGDSTESLDLSPPLNLGDLNICVIAFSQSAVIMKAMVGAIIAAVVMLI